MANIQFKIDSTYLPIFATLREDDINGDIVKSKVLQQSGQVEVFSGVTAGDYVVVGYDSAFGVIVSSGVTVT